MKYKPWVICLIATICVSCFVARNNGKDRIAKINFTYTLPVKISPTEVDVTSINFRVIYSKDKIMYELPYRESFAVDGKMISDTTRYEFFVYGRGDKKGYLLKSMEDTATRLSFNADTLLEERAFRTLDLERFLSAATLVRSYKKNETQRVNVYSFNDNFLDSGYYYFDEKLSGIEFSLSKKLDSMYGSKLYKTELLSRKDTSVNADYLNKFRTIRFEIDTLPVSNENELLRFFSRF